MVLVQLALSMQKNVSQNFLISLYKAQVQMDQEPPHKTQPTESNKRAIAEDPWRHRHKEKFPEQNTSGLHSKIKNQQMETHKTVKVL